MRMAGLRMGWVRSVCGPAGWMGSGGDRKLDDGR